MPPGPEPDPGRRTAAAPPRPTWVVVLAVAMLAYGGHLLTTGLSVLQGLRGPAPAPVAASAEGSVSDQGLMSDLRSVSRSLDRSHPVAVRANAVSKLVLAALLLLAVAAVFTSDPRARPASLVAAWAGIAHHVGDALYLLLVVREGVIAAAPLLASVASQRGADPVPSAEEMAAFADTFMKIVSAVTAALGISFSALLLAYFGGRKGRLFFGAGTAERPVGDER